MTFANIASAARLHIRAELLVAEIRFRRHLRKMALMAVAAAVGLVGLVFVNVALYQYLAASWGPVLAPLALGAVNGVLALLLLLVAAASRPGPELAAAEELRKLTAETLEADVKAGPLSLAGMVGSTAYDFQASRLLVPVIGLIIDALRRRKKAPGP
ncbi:MAG: hypothetical protein HY245_12395 [Rhizobiales bacterium]|nr:hypothetical protein [Hyphomicrobiales bacterium]MBI3674189.1 hypothetical protein [Hyphomicrobiales bacterium]